MSISRRTRVALFALLVALTCFAGASTLAASAVAAPGPRLASDGDSTLLIKPDGGLWAWGYNDHGQLGLGDAILRPTAFRVGTASDWATVACGENHGLAVKRDGSLWAWGDNTYGQLGLGDTTARSAPVRVGSASDWVLVFASDNYSFALKSDGSLWAWGSNAYGQLGLGDSTGRTVPTQVGTAHDWATVVCGAEFALALKSDGSLWAWGRNTRSQLGLGDTTTRLAPTRVGADTDWALARCGDEDVRALKSNGTLWAWGRNNYGQLGFGDTVTRSAPTQVGQDSDWTTLACGDDHTVALKSDGSLWAWGANSYGDLGTADTTAHWSPTRVGSANDWTGLVCGDNHSLGLKSDGSLWSWGCNNVGQLDLADFVNRTVPVFAFFTGDTDAPAIASLDSSTHPDSAHWYANNSPSFSWSAADASGIGGYRYTFDHSATAAAPVAYPHFETTISYTGQSDGIWYFHLHAVDRAGNWGPTMTRAVRIDTTAPVTTQTGADSAWHSTPVTVTFKASDALSGVAGTEYRLDDGPWTPGTSLTVSSGGAHTILYRSRDNAGNVEADKTCQVNILGAPTTYTITPSVVGANGTISPNTVQTVTINTNSPAFTFTPATGYHIADVLIDGTSNPAAVTAGTYTFTNVVANHTISATFDTNTPAITVTAPTGTGSYAQGSPVTVTWNSSPAVTSGQFAVFSVSSTGGWYGGDIVSANGGASYTHNLILNGPNGTGYTIAVMYRPSAGSAWTTGNWSPGTFAVTGGTITSLAVTAPTGTGSYTVGSSVTVSWTADTTVSTGEFGVFAVSSTGGWYVGDLVPANGASASYTHNLALNVPVGTGYSIAVMYRATAGSGTWTIGNWSPGTFSVN